MSKAHQQPSSNGGYSSPRNLEHRLQMLPLASAGSNLSSIMDKQLLALPALQLPPPGSKTLPPSISSSITKTRVPALPLAALPAPPTDTTSEAAPAAQQPLPVVAYKPKPKPVETAFGYRVPSGGAKQSSRSGSAGKSSILDSSYGSAAVTPGRDDTAAGSGGSSSRAGLSREGSTLMGPLSLPDSRGGGSASNGRFFDIGGSKVPLSPRAGQRKADAFGSNSSNSSGSSKIPKPPAKAGGRHNSSTSGTSSKERSYRASAAQDEDETIFLDCDGEHTHTGGQSKPVGFTLSCAINAVFNVAGGSSGSSGSGGGMEASSLIQTMGAALSRSIMSATQQHAGSHAQQREPVRGASRPSSPARNRRSSNGNNNHTPKQAAASPNTARSSRGSVSSGTGSGGARSRAQSGGSTPTTKALQILPATSNFRAVGDSAGAASSSSATVAGSAAQTATTIFMQLQGNAAGQQPASSRGASSPTGSGYDSAFYSCVHSEATSVACSEAGSDKGSAQQQQQLLAPRSRVLKAAGPSILDPAAGLALTAHATGTDGELVRYVSANTAASWTTASDVGEIVSVEDSEQQPKQAQGQQQQLKAGTPSMLHSSTPPSFEKSLLELEQSLQSLEATAAAAAAAEGIEAATNAAFAGKAAAADAHEREVVLTITPRALPFLAARAFSQTPVRLVITQDAVWGDLAAFTAAAAGEDSSSAAAGGEGQTKKKKKKAGLFSRSARSSKCE